MTDLVTQPLLFMLLGAVVVSARVHVCEAKWSVTLVGDAAGGRSEQEPGYLATMKNKSSARYTYSASNG